MIRDLQQLRVLVAEHEFIVANDIAPPGRPHRFQPPTNRGETVMLDSGILIRGVCPFCLRKRWRQFQGSGTPLIR